MNLFPAPIYLASCWLWKLRQEEHETDDQGEQSCQAWCYFTFFNLFQKNKEIVELYRDKIINNSDVNELYYYSKFFCQLIIDCNSEDEYRKKIPVYLFKEKNYLIDIYRKYNSKKKKMLLKLLSSTESILRKESVLSLVVGLRFLLNIKKITIS